jgi:hypothetical protein
VPLIKQNGRFSSEKHSQVCSGDLTDGGIIETPDRAGTPRSSEGLADRLRAFEDEGWQLANKIIDFIVDDPLLVLDHI